MKFYQAAVTVKPASDSNDAPLTLTALVKVPASTETAEKEQVLKNVSGLLFAPIPYNVDPHNSVIDLTPAGGEVITPPETFETNTPAMRIMPDGVKVWLTKKTPVPWL